MRRVLAGLALAAGLSVTASASAGVYRLEVTATSVQGVEFSSPIFTFYNLSSAGLQVSGVGVSDGPPWDWISTGPAPYGVTNPAGGSRTLLEGQESPVDQNEGIVSAAVRYSLTGFDPGEVFSFSPDPEASNGGAAVIDIRPWLDQDLLRVTASFAGGPGATLTGTNWTLEYIDPQADHGLDGNQRYRLVLEQSFVDAGVPEPASWALMIIGMGLAGATLRRQRPGATA
jgi:hypothetical protein